VTVLFVLVALAVIAGIGLLAVGRLGELPPVEPDRTPDLLPDAGPLGGADVDRVRFDVGLRGYRMDEVDQVLDRVAADLAARDAIIAELRGRLGEDPGPLLAPSGSAPGAEPEAGDGAVAADPPAATPGLPAAAEAATDDPVDAPASSGASADDRRD
jgi:DivIVA domain-containing protein